MVGGKPTVVSQDHAQASRGSVAAEDLPVGAFVTIVTLLSFGAVSSQRRASAGPERNLVRGIFNNGAPSPPPGGAKRHKLLQFTLTPDRDNWGSRSRLARKNAYRFKFSCRLVSSRLAGEKSPLAVEITSALQCGAAGFGRWGSGSGVAGWGVPRPGHERPVRPRRSAGADSPPPTRKAYTKMIVEIQEWVNARCVRGEAGRGGAATAEVRGKRPFKIWDSSRNVRKGLVVTSFEELIHRGEDCRRPTMLLKRIMQKC
ncbi:hypothetical protein MSG28_003712 [Choristoneura fumiferana]|uniref:Uncharacterized protein n=1 Tax=Choristoneura fumiferana TaxID=7141 RepID=A0ACC0KFW4_CHOFU|nr:hypothetical protein MSG28_003712 [Choristoneura fumiferana]